MKVMAIAEYGFFFFLLSKLLAIKAGQYEPQGSGQLSGLNGVTNGWAQTPSQGMTNDRNYHLNTMYGNGMYSQSPLNYVQGMSYPYYNPMDESSEDSIDGYGGGAYGDHYHPTNMQYTNANQPMDYDYHLSEYQSKMDPSINSQLSLLQSPTPMYQSYYPPTQGRSDNVPFAPLMSPMEINQGELAKNQNQLPFTGGSNLHNGNENQNNPIQPSPTSDPQLINIPLSPMPKMMQELLADLHLPILTGGSNLNNGNENQNNLTQPSPTSKPQSLNVSLSPVEKIQQELSANKHQPTSTEGLKSNNGNENQNNSTQPSPTSKPQSINVSLSPVEKIQQELSANKHQPTSTEGLKSNNGNENQNNPIQPSPTSDPQLINIPLSPMPKMMQELLADLHLPILTGGSNLNNGNENQNNLTQPSPTSKPQSLNVSLSPVEKIQQELSANKHQPTSTEGLKSNNGNENQNNSTQPSPTSKPQSINVSLSPVEKIQQELSANKHQPTSTEGLKSNNGNENQNNPIQPSPTSDPQLINIPLSPMPKMMQELLADLHLPILTGGSNLNNGNENQNNLTQPSPTSKPQSLNVSLSPVEKIQQELSANKHQPTSTEGLKSNNGNENQNNSTQPSSTSKPQSINVSLSPVEKIQQELSANKHQPTSTEGLKSNNGNENQNNPTQPSPTSKPQSINVSLSPVEKIQQELSANKHQPTSTGGTHLNNEKETKSTLSLFDLFNDELFKIKPQPTSTGESNSNNGNENKYNPIQPPPMSNPQLINVPLSPVEKIQQELSANKHQPTSTEELKSNNGNENQNNPIKVHSTSSYQPFQSSMTPMEIIPDELLKSKQALQSHNQSNTESFPSDHSVTNHNNDEKNKPEKVALPEWFSASSLLNPFSQVIKDSSQNADSTNKPHTSHLHPLSVTNSDSIPLSDISDSLLKTEPQVGPTNDQSSQSLPNFDYIKSPMEIRLENDFSSPTLQFESKNKFGVSNKTNNKLEHAEFDEPLMLNELAKYDKSYNLDIENPKSWKETQAELLTYANPNDIHIQKLPSIQPTSTFETKFPTNIDLLNTLPTNYPLPNYSGNTNSNQLLGSLFNYNQNKMFYNQMPTGKSNLFDINEGQKQMTSTDLNPLSSDADSSGHIFKQIDLTNPPPYITSWSLLKPDNDSKLRRPNQNNNYISSGSPINTPGTPSQYSQNYNQGTSIPPLNNIPILNMMSTISNAINTPPGATKVIFDVTQANLPRIPIVEQIQLTYVITKSIALGLQKMFVKKTNIFSGQQEYLNSATPAATTALPKTSESDDNLPMSGFLEKKYFQPNTAPTVKNTDSVQRQMNNSGMNLNFESQGNMDYLVQTKNTQQLYLTDLLANEIKNVIYSYLPDSYTRDSPEINEYIRQIIVAVGLVYHDQINGVLRGPLPILRL